MLRLLVILIITGMPLCFILNNNVGAEQVLTWGKCIKEGKGKQPVNCRIELGVFDERNIEVISGLEAIDKILIVTRRYLPAQNTTPSRNPFMPFGRRSPSRRRATGYPATR